MIAVEKIKQVLKKIYGKEILAVFLLLIAIYFFRSERRELTSIVPHLQQADTRWIIAGLLITVIYILMQSSMYINSFAAVGSRLTLGKAIELFFETEFSQCIPTCRWCECVGIYSLAYPKIRNESYTDPPGFGDLCIYRDGNCFHCWYSIGDLYAVWFSSFG